MAKTRGVPLAAMVTTAVVLLILVATATVATTAYISSNASIDELWNDLAANLTDRTTKEALRFLEPAVPAVALSDDMMRRGRLPASDPEAILAHLESTLDANPTFTWASWGAADGTYLSVHRWPVGDAVTVRRTWRRPTGDGPPDASRPTRHRDWDRQADGSWKLIRDDLESHYDPRVRPWYRKAAALPDGQGAWVDPFLFLSRMQPGVTHVRPTRDAGGALLGVWAAEFEAGPMSDFLGRLKVGTRGRVYLLDRHGRVVAHPRGEVVQAHGDPPDILRAAEHPDPMLSGAWKVLAAGHAEGEAVVADGQRVFEFGPYLAMAEPFPAASGIPWLVLTVVPSDDFFGEVRAQARTAAVVAGLATLLALVFGVFVSRALSRSIARLQDELYRISAFDLTDERLTESPSAIREINQMGRATDTMKEGLRSFGRYVPHQLVRRLLESGQEARLGGETRELTVLFSDIAGFTPIVEATPVDVVLTALGEYLGAMNARIATTDGTVCQYLGDGIMAFWGAPDPQPDHAVRACRGALAMRHAARALAATAVEHGHPPFRTRYGLNTGEVMVGNIGAPTRFNYAILGDAVNTASRLEGLNKVYGTEVIIGERTAELVAEALVVRPLDWVRMKGKHLPMPVFELVGAPDEVSAATLEGVARYREGLERYRARDFERARAIFEATGAALRREDGAPDPPSVLLATRCEAFAAAHPGADWDGVFEMKTK